MIAKVAKAIYEQKHIYCEIFIQLACNYVVKFNVKFSKLIINNKPYEYGCVNESEIQKIPEYNSVEIRTQKFAWAVNVCKLDKNLYLRMHISSWLTC